MSQHPPRSRGEFRGELKHENGACRFAEGSLPLLCPCGCNHLRIYLLNDRAEAFAVGGLTPDMAETFARELLSLVEKARSALRHGEVGHA